MDGSWCLGPCGPPAEHLREDLSSCEESSLSSDTSCSSVEFLRAQDVFSPQGWAKAVLQDTYCHRKISSSDEDEGHAVPAHLPKVSASRSNHRAKKLKRSTRRFFVSIFARKKENSDVFSRSWKQTVWPGRHQDKKVKDLMIPSKKKSAADAAHRSLRGSRTFKRLSEMEQRARLGLLSVSTAGYATGSVSHPSPNDSGVSSQSLTSSPQQSPRGPLESHRHPLLGSSATQDSGIYSHTSTLNQKSDSSSGRSSPWTPTRGKQRLFPSHSEPPSTSVKQQWSNPDHEIDALLRLSQNDFYRADPVSLLDYDDSPLYDNQYPSRDNNESTSAKDQLETTYLRQSESVNTRPLQMVEEGREIESEVKPNKTVVRRFPSTPTLRTAKRKSLDQALEELEKIYESLRLNDEMIMDGAERRDFPSRFQAITQKQLPLNKSIPVYGSYDSLVSPRKGYRRSGIPDKVRDDAAYRRFQRTTNASTKPIQTTQSYLLCSPTFTPTLDVEVLLKELLPQPDIEQDDLSYRAYKQSDGAKVQNNHPPFGIPISPAAQSSSSHYVHLQPGQISRPFLRPKETPDVTMDDLAFRALRKDCNPPTPKSLFPSRSSSKASHLVKQTEAPSSHKSKEPVQRRNSSCKAQAKPDDGSRHWVKDLELLLSSLN